MVQKAPLEGQNGNNISNMHPLQATGSYFKNMLLDVLAQSTSFEQNYLNGILQDRFRNLERWLEKESPSDFETDCINNLRIALEDGVALLQSPKINIDDVYKIEARIEQYCHSLNERIEVFPVFRQSNEIKFTKVFKPSNTTTDITITAGSVSKTFPIAVNNIDTEVPKGTVSYSTTVGTNENVTVSINLNKDVFNTPAGWTRVDARTFIKVYSSNASETVSFTDAAGNIGTTNVIVNNIDKVVPTGSVSYSTTAPTNGDVLVTISTSEDIPGTITGWTKVDARTFIKTYSSNASETINFVDAAGNTGTTNVIVNNIDKFPVSTLDFVGATPTEQEKTYAGLVLQADKSLSGAIIDSITSSSGGEISNFSINGAGNIVFTFTTPNTLGTQLRVQGTESNGNRIDVTKNISGLEKTE